MQRRKATSSHVQERGFTIVELVATVFILSMLIGLAISSVVGYQSVARDREREADVGIIKQSLERYYRTNAVATGATYPVTSIGATGLTAAINNPEATAAPDQPTSSIVIASTGAAQTPTISQYIYQPLNVNDTLCTVAPCVKFKIFYRLERENEIITVHSLRQQ